MHAAASLTTADDVVLVFIDMQERLLPVIHEQEAILAACQKLARAARILELPVVVCEQQKLGPTVAPLREILEQDAAWSPVAKSHFGCFAEPAFRQRLDEVAPSSQRPTLLLAGIESHVCVQQTALQALKPPAPRFVQVIADATGSRAPENRDLAFQRLRQAGVVLNSVEALIFELIGSAGHQAFRQVLPLVK